MTVELHIRQILAVLDGVVGRVVHGPNEATNNVAVDHIDVDHVEAPGILLKRGHAFRAPVGHPAQDGPIRATVRGQ